jgi:hypothetical protein
MHGMGHADSCPLRLPDVRIAAQRTRATTVHATLMQPLTSGRRLGRRQDVAGLIKRLHLNFCSGSFLALGSGGFYAETAGFYHVSGAGVAVLVIFPSSRG